MSKKIIKLIDNAFTNSEYCNMNNKSINIIWDRSYNINENDIVVFTDASLPSVSNISTNCKKIAWLIEPPIIQDNYSYIMNNWSNFDLILTHQEKLLSISDRFKPNPMWCSWIKPENQKIINKSKNLSIIASAKRDSTGHILRHNIIDEIRNKIDIDLFGNGYKTIDDKSEALLDYRFSIIIENDKSPIYFTEKIIDCLVSGVVPIYWGADKIGEHFNLNGFIIINNIEDVNKILSELTPEKYEELLPYVIENFEIAKKFLTVEDFIYENYIKYL